MAVAPVQVRSPDHGGFLPPRLFMNHNEGTGEGESSCGLSINQAS
jgi:hypothetical protein